MQRRTIMNIGRRHRAILTEIAAVALPASALFLAQTATAQNAAPVQGNSPTAAKQAATRTSGATRSGATKESEAARHTIDDAIQYARERRALLDDVKDYTATFTKTELVGKKVIKQTMDMKCRHEPFSIYLHNRAGKEEGREVLYIEGAHEGNLLVHERGLLASLAGTQSLKLDDTRVMDENRYPITDIGIAKIVDKSLAIWEAEKTADADNVEVRFIGNTKVGAVPCEEVEIIRKQERPEFKYSLTRVFFAKESKLPIRAEQFGWPSKPGDKAPLLEQYDYTDLHVNVGLTAADFDPKNPMYGFEGSPSK